VRVEHDIYDPLGRLPLARARASPKSSRSLDFVQSQSQSDPRGYPLLKSASCVDKYLCFTMPRARIPSSWRLGMGSSWPGRARALGTPARKRSLFSGGSIAAGPVGSGKAKTTALALGGGVTFALVSTHVLNTFLTSEKPDSGLVGYLLYCKTQIRQ
jgi:hypothetical protein